MQSKTSTHTTASLKKRRGVMRRPKAPDAAASRCTHLQQAPGWQLINVSDGVALHDEQFGSAHYLNHTAAAIYLLCKEPVSIREVCTILKEEFDLTYNPLDDVKQAIESMLTAGLIRTMVRPAKGRSRRKSKNSRKNKNT